MQRQFPIFFNFSAASRVLLAMLVGGLATGARAQVALTSLGFTAPTPGPNDCSALAVQYIPSNAYDAGFNYYTDNGAQNGACVGETFTTGSNAGGYTLNSVAVGTTGNASGNGYQVAQPYVLNIYLLNGTTATLVQSFSVPSFTFTDGAYYGNSAWMEWTGLAMPLLPNKIYAYTFGNTLLGCGFTSLGASGNSYAGGQVCIIPNAGGTVRYDSHNYDATFDVGLSVGNVAQAPTIYSQPAPKQLYPGATATFTASVAGAAPMTYQWLKNSALMSDGGRISGSHTNTLVISNINSGDAANYTLMASNSVQAVTSGIAALAVIPTPSNGSYAAAVIAEHPVAYWRLNETTDPSTNPPAFDYVNGLDGAYAALTTVGIAGLQPPSFTGLESDNTCFQLNNHQYQSEAVIPALNLNTNAVTLLAWVYPTVPQYSYEGLLFWRNNGDGAGMGYSTNNYLGYTWNTNAANTWGFSSSLLVPSNMWSMVALTISPTKAILYLFNANGSASATNTIPHDKEAFNSSGCIGDDPTTVGRIFTGDMDEVAVFNQTLTGANLASLYNTAVSGTVTAAPVTISIQTVAGGVQLSWPQGTLMQAPNPSGPWTANAATSPYTLPATGAQQFFRVLVQ